MLDGVGDHQAAVTDDGDVVGHSLNLVEAVRREQDGVSRRHRLSEERLELHLNEWVEPTGRLVEHQQLGSVHEGEEQADLLAVPLRQLADGAVEADPETINHLGREPLVVAAARPGAPPDQVTARHAIEQLEIAGHVADPPADLHAVAPRVEPQHASLSTGGPLQVEERAEGR